MHAYGQGPSGIGRGPKYRTSCDNCQAAKVKCGHEKPSCRRCSVQKLKCVYSLSRRMGRPRAKKNVSEDSTRRQSNVESDDETRSKSATPAAGFAGSEATIAVGSNPRLEAGVSGPSLSEPMQRPDPWTPIVGDFAPPDANKSVDDSNTQPMTSSLDFLPTDTFMELDEISAFLTMPFSEDSSTLVDSQRPISAASADRFEPQDLLSTRLPVTHDKGSFGSIDSRPSLQQRQSNHGSPQCLGPHSYPSYRAESASGSSNAAPLNQTFGFAFEFLSDMGSTSQDTRPNTSSNTSGHGGAPAYPDTIAPPKPSAAHISSEEDSWSPSGCRALTDQRRAHCNCISAASQRIGSLKTEQQKTSSIPIDCALMMESEVEESLSRLHRCKSCCHDSTVHLLALVGVRTMLDLLQKTAHDEFVSRPRRANPSWAASRSRSMHDASPERQRSSGPVDSGILYIGNFKVTPRARSRFLRKVLQTRFYKLSVLVKEQEKLVNGIRQDCFTKAASLLLEDVSRGLRTIIGWVELWNSKDL